MISRQTRTARKLTQQLTAFAALLLALLAIAPPASAQMSRRTRRESNANRKARIAAATAATYAHRYELFGGGGYLRMRSGPSLQRNNEVTWATTATYFLNPKLGITAAAQGGYGNAKLGNNIYSVYNPLIEQFTFMGGVSYRVRATQKSGVTLHALAGESLGNFDTGTKAIPANLLGLYPSEFRPVFQLGASYDYNFYPNLAFRVTPNFLGNTFGGSFESDLGINAGIIYRFGRIK